MNFIQILLSFFKDEQYKKLLFFTTVVIGLGTVAYHYLENWSWIDSLYFSVITLTTIGYGDLYPITTAGKLFTILYIIVGLGIILFFIETIHVHYEKEHKGLK